MGRIIDILRVKQAYPRAPIRINDIAAAPAYHERRWRKLPDAEAVFPAAFPRGIERGGSHEVQVGRDVRFSQRTLDCLKYQGERIRAAAYKARLNAGRIARGSQQLFRFRIIRVTRQIGVISPGSLRVPLIGNDAITTEDTVDDSLPIDSVRNCLTDFFFIGRRIGVVAIRPRQVRTNTGVVYEDI